MIRKSGPSRAWTAVLAAGVIMVGPAASASAQDREHDHDPGFVQKNLVSDVAGLAAHTDANLKNPWGISFLPGSPLWISDNGAGVSTLYDGAGVATPLVVTIPAAASSAPSGGTPTGTVSNPAAAGFVVSENGVSSPSRFLFATEDGTLAGWSPTVDRGNAITVADRSTVVDPEGDVGAVYKGLAMASTPAGQFLYATNFRFGQVEVFDRNFTLVRTFTDPDLPSGYGPFGIATIGGNLFVTFAKQDAQKHDDVAGSGLGFVDVFSPGGKLLQHFASHGRLNSPWGVTKAPASVPGIGGDILVGNFGDGRINVYSPRGHFVRALSDTRGHPITISGLWDLKFPTGALNVTPGALYFTAGINGEADGLFGELIAAR
ncbi:TIGR03118 family protein [Nakamurella panacisegetis]|uniref:TIGR03118 family protein n=1 Tax=Nakamurella panacisegetis TaxID=1090615 RepID=A0A1H0RAW8_9ACTN|nr:TIGR03118 family protein [Nakamurella panacisegetis]SDP26654.1 TIGR03118 family protein [Nakamurella panacisegetis]